MTIITKYNINLMLDSQELAALYYALASAGGRIKERIDQGTGDSEDAEALQALRKIYAAASPRSLHWKN
jgi:hypothetical protein